MCRIMLHGLASRSHSDRELNSSKAFAAAEAAINTWTDEGESDGNDKAAHVRAVARAEFGRKGYEVTTIRDIAAAAGLGTGTVYRLIGSKDELLASIMESFGTKPAAASPAFCAPMPRRWRNWTRSAGSTSMRWISSPTSGRSNSRGCANRRRTRPTPAWRSPCDYDNSERCCRKGSSRATSASRIRRRCRCWRATSWTSLWVPENIVRAQGKHAALLNARDTLVRGAAERDTSASI